MRKHFVFAVALLLVGATAAMGWWVKGHGTIAEAAAARLPEGMPQFFRAAGKQLAHLAGDPDRWKNPAAKHLRPAEAPAHFIDLAHFEATARPPHRYNA